MKKSSKIILSIFTPIITLLVLCLGLAFSKPGGVAFSEVDYGGAIYVHEGTTYDLTNGNITGHSAINGGAVYVKAKAFFNMTGGKITGNTASGNGGAIFVPKDAEAEIGGGEISGNTAAGGGGISNFGTVTITGGVFSGNKSTGTYKSGDIFNSGMLNINGGTFSSEIYNMSTNLNFGKATFNEGAKIITEYPINIKTALATDLPLKWVGALKNGLKIATLDSSVQRTQEILNHIKLEDMPDTMKLWFDGHDIIVTGSYTLTLNATSYGKIELNGQTNSSWGLQKVPHNSELRIEGNVLIVAAPGANEMRITAKANDPDDKYSYKFSSWYNVTDSCALQSGTKVTKDLTIQVNFTREELSYVFSVTTSTPGVTITPSSIKVPKGATFRIDGDTIYSSDGQTMKASWQDGYNLHGYQFCYEIDKWDVSTAAMTGDRKGELKMRMYYASYLSTRAYLNYGRVWVTRIYPDGSEEVLEDERGGLYDVFIPSECYIFRKGNMIVVRRDDHSDYLWISPDPDVRFRGWTSSEGRFDATNNRNEEIMIGRYSKANQYYYFDANFDPCYLRVAAWPQEGGSVDMTEYTLPLPYGTEWTISGNKITFSTGLVVTAKPAQDTDEYSFAFSQWSDMRSGEKLPDTGIVTDNLDIDAVFKKYYAVTFTSNYTYMGGWRTYMSLWGMTPSRGKTETSIQTYISGDIYTQNNIISIGSSSLSILGYEAVPYSGCTVSSWLVNGRTFYKSTTYRKLTTITEVTTIKAVFEFSSSSVAAKQPAPEIDQTFDIEIRQSDETPFIDRRRGVYALEASQERVRNYNFFDICYPI